MFDITIYCPDTHILYNNRIVEQKGLGGGLIARILMAEAFARYGHFVTMIANVTHSYRWNGVNYLPLSMARQKTKTDILILATSGGALSLEPAMDLDIQARWRGVRIGSFLPIKGLDQIDYDVIIPQSNFVSRVIREEWKILDRKQFVIYQGVSVLSPRWFLPKRNPFRLIYISHPDKGLTAAIRILERLRKIDSRYHLWIFGGDGMYGGEDKVKVHNKISSAITYFGSQPNSKVLNALQTALVSLQLQSRREPFGKVVTESMLHGCIPIASSVGAYPEIIIHGENGFLLDGDYQSDEVQEGAVEWILRLNQNPQFAAYIRKNASSIPWRWDIMTQVWTGYWEWVLHRKGTLLQEREICKECNGQLLALADGYHCIDCGWYYQSLA